MFLQLLCFGNQSSNVSIRGQVVITQDFQNVCVRFLIELRRNTALNMSFPPLLNLLDGLFQFGITLRQLERTNDGVLSATPICVRVLIVLVTQEATHHNHVIYTQKVRIKRSLQSIILRDILNPVL